MSCDWTSDGKLGAVLFEDETRVDYADDGFGRLAARTETYWQPNGPQGPLPPGLVANENAKAFGARSKRAGELPGNGKVKNPRANRNAYGKLQLREEVTAYLYEGRRVMKEYTGNGSPLAQYYLAGDQVVARKMFGLKGRKDQGREGNLQTRGGLLYYQYDGLGNVTSLTDHLGEPVMAYRYDAFGGLLTGLNAPYNPLSVSGKRYDGRTGLVDFSSRWYAPDLGRFLSPDVVQGLRFNLQSQNPYVYVGNNPVNYVDPYGYYIAAPDEGTGGGGGGDSGSGGTDPGYSSGGSEGGSSGGDSGSGDTGGDTGGDSGDNTGGGTGTDPGGDDGSDPGGESGSDDDGSGGSGDGGTGDTGDGDDDSSSGGSGGGGSSGAGGSRDGDDDDDYSPPPPTPEERFADAAPVAPAETSDEEGEGWLAEGSWARRTASALASMTPFVGEALDASSVITGYDVIAGEKLTAGERLLGAAAFFVPFMGAGTVRGATKLAAEYGDEALEAISGGRRFHLQLFGKSADDALPNIRYPGNNPARAPGKGWEWRG